MILGFSVIVKYYVLGLEGTFNISHNDGALIYENSNLNLIMI